MDEVLLSIRRLANILVNRMDEVNESHNETLREIEDKLADIVTDM